jgi:hypothetical protein
MRRMQKRTRGHTVCYTGALQTRILRLHTRRGHRVQRMLHENLNEDTKGSWALGPVKRRGVTGA